MWLSLSVPLLDILERIGKMAQLGGAKPFNLRKPRDGFFLILYTG